MATYNIGRIRPNKRGDWNSSDTYLNFDAVRYQDQWWIANKDVPANTVPVEGEYWSLFGIKGDTQRPDNETLELNKDGLMAIKPEVITDIYDKVCDPINVKDTIVETHPVESYPVKVKSFLEPWQEGEGDPSPTNVRPIHGWDKVEVSHSGKNLFNINKVLSRKDTDVFKNKGDHLLAKRTPSTLLVSAGGDSTLKNYIGSVPYGTTVYFNAVTSSDLPSIYLIPANKTIMMGSSFVVTKELVESSVYWYGYKDKYDYAKISDISFTIGDTALPFEPYHGQTFTQELPEEVYGGEYDWETGVLMVSWVKQNFSDTKFAHNVSAQIFAADTQYSVSHNIARLPSLCNRLKRGIYTWGGFEIGGNSRLLVYHKENEEINSLSKFVEWYTANPTYVVYPIKDPYTIQLQPHLPPSAFKGTNIFYSNCGQTEITAREDPVYTRQQLRNAILAQGGNNV